MSAPAGGRPPSPERQAGQAAADAATAAAAAAAGVRAVPDSGAFVELDHTLVTGSATFALARGLAARGSLTTRDLAAMVWHHARYSASGLGGDDETEGGPAVYDTSLDYLAGRRVSDLVWLADEIFDEYVAENVWPGTQALVQRHLQQGERVWLLASTPAEISQVYARRLGLTGALSTVAEVRNGRYTGRLIGRPLHGAARAEAVTALARQEGLDLSRCTAYAHSTDDLPLLDVIGNAVCVNPLPTLHSVARQRDWRVYDWRRRQRRWGAAAGALGVAAAGLGIAAGAAWRGRSAG